MLNVNRQELLDDLEERSADLFVAAFGIGMP